MTNSDGHHYHRVLRLETEVFDALEELPPALRSALCEAVGPFDSVEVLGFYWNIASSLGERGAMSMVLNQLARSERQLVTDGGAEAHLRAGATILRYHEAAKHGRRRPSVRPASLPRRLRLPCDRMGCEG